MTKFDKTILSAGVGVVLLVLLTFILSGSPIFGYIGHIVNETQIGIKIRGGEFIEIVPSGTYSDPFCFFCDIYNVDVTGFPFTVNDPEVLTLGAEQRIGVTVSGLAFRPGLSEMTQELWSDYRILYTNNEAMVGRLSELTKQAMKVCVGQRSFEQAAVGADRNDLADCIDAEISEMSSSLSIDIRNIVVSDIQISEQAKAKLDALTQARQDIELEKANAELEKARAEAELAKQQGVILVQEGSTQEVLRQRAISALLEEEAVRAELAVVKAEAETERLKAQNALELAGINQSIAEIQALSNTAQERAVAALYAEHPAYAQYLTARLVAEALAGVEKVYLPVGTNPLLIIGQETPDLLLPVPEQP